MSDAEQPSDQRGALQVVCADDQLAKTSKGNQHQWPEVQRLKPAGSHRTKQGSGNQRTIGRNISQMAQGDDWPHMPAILFRLNLRLGRTAATLWCGSFFGSISYRLFSGRPRRTIIAARLQTAATTNKRIPSRCSGLLLISDIPRRRIGRRSAIFLHRTLEAGRTILTGATILTGLAIFTGATIFPLLAFFAGCAFLAIAALIAVTRGILLPVIGLLTIKALLLVRLVFAFRGGKFVLVRLFFAAFAAIVGAGALLFLTDTGIGDHAEIVVGKLQVIFGLNAITVEVCVLRQLAILFEHLGGIAPCAAVDPVELLAATLRAAVVPATAPAVIPTIVVQVGHFPVSVQPRPKSIQHSVRLGPDVAQLPGLIRLTPLPRILHHE